MSDLREVAELNRRRWLQGVAATMAVSQVTPARAASVRRSLPTITHGVGSGDPRNGSAVVWSRADRASRMVVEYATNERFQNSRTVLGPTATPETGFTAQCVITGLPPGQTIVYRVSFRDLDRPNLAGEPVLGRLKTAAADRSDVSFVWGGDVAGQGWGIDESRGGMTTFEAMRAANPDFFLHSGDHIYADNPIPAEVRLDDGTIWKNLVTVETSKVAETLDEYRGRYLYNRLDQNFRQFAAEVPVIAQWDDHEVRNNWYPGQTIADDARYTETRLDVLASRARQAFREQMPIAGAEPIHRVVNRGPLLDVFLLDQRSFRGPNSPNRQTEESAATAFLGAEQLAWLKTELKRSRAVWKAIASDMPLGLVIGDGPRNFEAVANGDGPALGRELEIADLLAFVKREPIENLVWFTADVHYAAAHRYDPSRAQFTDFNPFWEFVAGPLHAGTFGPGRLDDTFGPVAEFSSIPPGTKANRPPSDGLQFFGAVNIEGKTGVMTVSLHDRAGKRLDSRELVPV